MKAILFGNDTCGSCLKWKPVFERLMVEEGIEYQVINVDIDKEMKDRYKITAIPVTIFFNDDKEIGNILGNMNEDIARKQIDYYRNV